MRRPSSASQQLTEQSNQPSPQELEAIKRERARTLELQNQVHTQTAQEWMRSKGVQGRPGTAEWREGRRALLEEYRDKLPPSRDWAHNLIADALDGLAVSHYQLNLAKAATKTELESA